MMFLTLTLLCLQSSNAFMFPVPEGLDKVENMPPEFDDTLSQVAHWQTRGEGLCSNNDGGHPDLHVSKNGEDYNTIEKCRALCESMNETHECCYGIVFNAPYCAVYLYWSVQIEGFLREKVRVGFGRKDELTTAVKTSSSGGAVCETVTYTETCDYTITNGATIFSIFWMWSIGTKAELWPFFLANVPGSNNGDCEKQCCTKSACVAYELRGVLENDPYCRLYKQDMSEGGRLDERAAQKGVVLAFKHDAEETEVADTHHWAVVEGNGMCSYSEGGHPGYLVVNRKVNLDECERECEKANTLKGQKCYGISYDKLGRCLLNVQWVQAHEGTLFAAAAVNWNQASKIDAVTYFEDHDFICKTYSYTSSEEDEYRRAELSVQNLVCDWHTLINNKIYSPMWNMPFLPSTYIGLDPTKWPFYLSGPIKSQGINYCQNICCANEECTAFEQSDGQCMFFKIDMEEGGHRDHRIFQEGFNVYFRKTRGPGVEADVGQVVVSSTAENSWMPTYTDGIAFVMGAIFAAAVVAAYNSRKGSSLEAYLIASEEV